MYGYQAHGKKEQILQRLKRIEGQVRGIHRMVDQDSYCIDILTQVSAANNALKKVAVGLLEDHIAHCMANGASEDERARMVAEATAAIDRLVKS